MLRDLGKVFWRVYVMKDGEKCRNSSVSKGIVIREIMVRET